MQTAVPLWICSTTSCTRRPTSTGASRSAMWPDSILEMSRYSSTNSARRLPSDSMISRYFRCCSAPSGRVIRVREKPMMEVSGVRSSWETRETKSDFSWSSSISFLRLASNCAACSCSSRCRCSNSIVVDSSRRMKRRMARRVKKPREGDDQRLDGDLRDVEGRVEQFGQPARRDRQGESEDAREKRARAGRRLRHRHT